MRTPTWFRVVRSPRTSAHATPSRRGPGGAGPDGGSATITFTHDYYRMVRLLGNGTYGVVIEAADFRSQPPARVAIKLLRRGDIVSHLKAYVIREIANQSALRHPLIVTAHQVVTTPEYLALVMEYIPGGNLLTYINSHEPARLCEFQARWFFQQLCLGVDYMHRRNIANRDLKLENLLLDRDGADGTRPLLKICDFGFSKHATDSPAKSTVGTLVYSAPEVFLGAKYDAKVADMWSCGVILYVMLVGSYPFCLDNLASYRRLALAEYDTPAHVQVKGKVATMVEAAARPRGVLLAGRTRSLDLNPCGL